MYTDKQVDDMLSQVEQEFEKAIGSITKSEEIEVEAIEEEVETEELAKSEEESNYETVDELYASMDKSEKEAHYNSVKKAMFGEEEVAATMEKSEEVEVEVEAVEEETMAKSEGEIALEVENGELKKSLDNMNELLGKLFNKKAPTGKAVTNISYIAKSEEVNKEDESFSKMSKSEITSELNKIDYSNLSKTDKTAINEFCLENGSVDKIKHLIKIGE